MPLLKDDSMNSSSPNEQLTEEVVTALVTAGLIKPFRIEALRTALSTGKCKASDWRIWAEDFAREESKP